MITSELESQRKQRLLIFDLDGCVVDGSERARTRIDHAAKQRGDLEAYYRSLATVYSQTCEGDVPIPTGISVVNALRVGLSVDRAVALTMRGNEARASTISWLTEHLPFPFEDGDLYMSPGRFADENGNYYQPNARNLKAVDFKRETALEFQQVYDVVLAVDDHPDICQMYQSIGIPVLCMLYPNVDCLTPVGDPRFGRNHSAPFRVL